jgi:mannose-1-phosphate guanylyltransferase
MQIIPLILAGGGGTRLWPLSRGHYPKQFLAVTPGATLLQGTLQRVGTDTLAGLQAPVVVCNEEHRFLVGEQARQIGRPFERIILEPVGRNTAPALTCAALCYSQDGADPLLLMMPWRKERRALSTSGRPAEKNLARVRGAVGVLGACVAGDCGGG